MFNTLLPLFSLRTILNLFFSIYLVTCITLNIKSIFYLRVSLGRHKVTLGSICYLYNYTPVPKIISRICIQLFISLTVTIFIFRRRRTGVPAYLKWYLLKLLNFTTMASKSDYKIQAKHDRDRLRRCNTQCGKYYYPSYAELSFVSRTYHSFWLNNCDGDSSWIVAILENQPVWRTKSVWSVAIIFLIFWVLQETLMVMPSLPSMCQSVWDYNC